MKIKQQKQVKSYLIEEFGPNKGNEIFDKQEKELYKIIENTKDKNRKSNENTHSNNSTTNCFYIKSY